MDTHPAMYANTMLGFNCHHPRVIADPLTAPELEFIKSLLTDAQLHADRSYAQMHPDAIRNRPDLIAELYDKIDALQVKIRHK